MGYVSTWITDVLQTDLKVFFVVIDGTMEIECVKGTWT